MPDYKPELTISDVIFLVGCIILSIIAAGTVYYWIYVAVSGLFGNGSTPGD